MKRILLLMLIGSALSLAWNYSKDQDEKMPVYIYDVDYHGTQYNFIVTLIEREPELIFEWEMTDPVNKTAKVTITEDALENAIKQNNYFSGKDITLKDETTVWVSKKVFRDFKEGEAVINVGAGEEKLVRKGRQTQHIHRNAEHLNWPVLYGETDKGNKFWILDDEENPLIVKMDLGWVIELKNIK